MTIIRMTANPSGAYPSPQDWFDEDIPDGFAAIPPEIDLRGFFDAQGFVIPTFVAKSLTGYTVNQEALDAWNSAHPTPDPLEAAKSARISELSIACNTAIVAGCDVTLSTTTGHISLTDEDQINLTTAVGAVQQGSTGYPYHLDGQLCAIYPAADIIAMGAAATAHKLYHTTYCNHLMAWARRATADELERITYGAALPADLAANMEEVLTNAADM